MKKISIVFYFSLVTAVSHAQTYYLLSRGALMENDSVTGYYFLNQAEKIDKRTAAYEIEAYNRSMQLVDKGGFTMHKDWEFISCNISGKYAHAHFRNYHRDLNGNPRKRLVESKMEVYDITARKIVKEVMLPKPKYQMQGTNFKPEYDYTYLSNGKVLNVVKDKAVKNKQVLQLLTSRLDTVWQSWLNDDKYKYCTTAKAYNVNENNFGVLVTKGKKENPLGGNVNCDFRVFSYDKGDMLAKVQLYNEVEKTLCDIRSTFYNKATNEYFICGNYLSVKEAFFGFKYNELGMFITKLNLSDTSNAKTKIFTWAKDFPGFTLDEKGNLPKKNNLDAKKIVCLNNTLYIVGCFENTSKFSNKPGIDWYAYLNFGGPIKALFGGEEKGRLLSNDLNRSQAIAWQEPANELNPINNLKDNLWLLEVSTTTLDIQKFSFLSGKTDYTSRKFSDGGAYYADFDITYYPLLKTAQVLCFFPTKNNSQLSKSTLVSLQYDFNTNCKSDQMELSEKPTWTEYYPARAGYVMIVEYYEGEKKLTQRIEKFNY
ncbi:MAG: DUF6770 family protein [Bacteroidia bacterium]